MSSIAYLGTGLLGAAFVEAALGRGDRVTVWNRTTEKARALEAFGATVASSPADAVRDAERVHLVLPDDAIVNEVIAALRPGLGADIIIVDHSTTQPALTAARALRLEAEGVPYLHCPVFIGPVAARKAEGVIIASGPSALFERVRPALEKQAAKVQYLGERADLAAVFKLVGNGFILGMYGLVADVLTVAKGADVPSADALELLDLFDPGAIARGRGKAMVAGNLTPSFELVMARKDVRLMLETAGALPLGPLAGLATRMDDLLAQGHAHDDVGILAKDAVRPR